jgi:hypothetical protein
MARRAPGIVVAAVTQRRQWQRAHAIGGSDAVVDAASSNRCLRQCDEERRLDVLRRRLVSWCMAGIALVMRTWPGQGIGGRSREGLTAGPHVAASERERKKCAAVMWAAASLLNGRSSSRVGWVNRSGLVRKRKAFLNLIYIFPTIQNRN